MKVDPNKNIYSIRSNKNIGERIDINGNHTQNLIRRQEGIVAIRIVYYIGIDDGIQVDPYERHIKTIVIQIKHFVWIGIYVIDIISISIFNVFGSDINEKIILYWIFLCLHLSKVSLWHSHYHTNHPSESLRSIHLLLNNGKTVSYEVNRVMNTKERRMETSIPHTLVMITILYLGMSWCIQFRHHQNY